MSRQLDVVATSFLTTDVATAYLRRDILLTSRLNSLYLMSQPLDIVATLWSLQRLSRQLNDVATAFPLLLLSRLLYDVATSSLHH